MIWIAGICVLCLCVCMPCYMHYKKELNLPLASAFKSAGTLCAFLPALIAAIRLDPRCWICSAALLLYAVADIAVEYHAFAGTGFCMAGHICAAAFLLGSTQSAAVIVVSALILSGVTAYVFWTWRKRIGKNILPFAIYAGTLILLCSAAMGSFTSATAFGTLSAIGGAFLMVSEMMKLRSILFPGTRVLEWSTMTIWYIALLLFGIACITL